MFFSGFGVFRIVDFILGFLGLAYFVVHLKRTIFDSKKYPWDFSLLSAVAGAVIAASCGIAAWSTAGWYYSGSQAGNEILAFLLTVSLALAYRRMSKKADQLERWKPLLYSLPILTVLIWVGCMVVMCKYVNSNRWKAYSYFANGLSLCIIGCFLAILLPSNVKGQTGEATKKRASFWLTLITIVTSSLLTAGYGFYSGQKVWRDNTPFVSPEERTDQTVRDTVITRIVGVFFLTTFTVILSLSSKPTTVHPAGQKTKETELAADTYTTPSVVGGTQAQVLIPIQLQPSVQRRPSNVEVLLEDFQSTDADPEAGDTADTDEVAKDPYTSVRYHSQKPHHDGFVEQSNVFRMDLDKIQKTVKLPATSPIRGNDFAGVDLPASSSAKAIAVVPPRGSRHIWSAPRSMDTSPPDPSQFMSPPESHTLLPLSSSSDFASSAIQPTLSGAPPPPPSPPSPPPFSPLDLERLAAANERDSLS